MAKGNELEALQLADEAIDIAHQSSAEIYQLKFQRELIRIQITGDYSGLIAVSQEALEVYKEQGNYLEQLDMLVNLVGLMHQVDDKPAAQAYLMEAQAFIASLTPEIIGHMNKQIPEDMQASLSAEVIVELRSAELQRLQSVFNEQ